MHMNITNKSELIQFLTLSSPSSQDAQKFIEQFLQKLKPCIDYDLAVFDMCKAYNMKTVFFDTVVASNYDSEFETNFINDYDTTFASLSYSRWLHNEKRNLCFRDTDIVAEKIRKTSTYYTQYLQRYGFDYALNCEYAINRTNVACLALYREAGKENFRDRELQELKSLTASILLGLTNSGISLLDAKADTLSSCGLTQREKTILSLVYNGLSNKSIADSLYITENTVKKHMSNILGKTNMKNRSQLTSWLHKEQYGEPL